jgi:lipopolysaccharide transport system ATP-binding protein
MVQITTELTQLVVGYLIKNRLGQEVFGTNTHHLKRVLKGVPGGASFTFYFDFKVLLGPGAYSVAVALHETDVHIGGNYEWRDLALIFNVVNGSQDVFAGGTWLPTTVTIS